MDENFIEIISQTNSMRNTITKNSLNIKIFSNTIINPIDKILKYNLKKKILTHSLKTLNLITLIIKKRKMTNFK